MLGEKKKERKEAKQREGKGSLCGVLWRDGSFKVESKCSHCFPVKNQIEVQIEEKGQWTEKLEHCTFLQGLDSLGTWYVE